MRTATSLLTAAALLTLIAGSSLAARQVTSSTTTTTTTTTTSQPPVINETSVVITPQARRHIFHRAPAPVKLDRVDVTLTIDGQVATTLLELSVANPSSTPQQAELLLPIPDGAAVRSLQYDGTGPEPTGKILPRDEARRIYDSIVNATRDPALLEFARYGVLRTSAFPIPPNSSQKIRITLEQLLPADTGGGGGRIDWMLPRTETLAGTDTPWTLKATVRNNDGLAGVFSSSHDLRAVRTGPNEFTVTGDAGAFRAAGSLRLTAMKSARNAGEPAWSTAAYPDAALPGGGGYFNVIVSLPSPAAGEQKALKREVTLVIDRSGSMRGEKFKQAVDAARNVISGLGDGEMFNIIDYSDSIAAFNTAPVAKDPDSLKRATAYLDGLQPNGGTNIRDALVEAVRATPQQGSLPLILFLTDGLPTVGERNEGAIRAAVKQANSASRRIFTFGVGFDVNSPLLSSLAAATRASSTFVTPDENIEVKVSQMFRRLQGPLFASPKVTFIDPATGRPSPTIVRDMQPNAAEMPDVFDGEQFMVSGRYTAGQKFKVRIDGDYLGKPHTFEYEIDPAAATMQNAWVARSWASRRIAGLIETLRTDYAEKTIDPRNDPRAKELIDEIVSLSTRFGILTEYTAFLATEPTVALRDDSVVRERAGGSLRRANDARSGADAVKQEEKLTELKTGYARDNDAGSAGAPAAPASPGALGGNQRQYYYDSAGRTLQRRELINVNQVQDRTFFKRNDRWIEGANITTESEKPDRTVVVGTDDYRALVDELLAADLGALLALDADVYFTWKGQRILIQQAPTN